MTFNDEIQLADNKTVEQVNPLAFRKSDFL